MEGIGAAEIVLVHRRALRDALVGDRAVGPRCRSKVVLAAARPIVQSSTTLNDVADVVRVRDGIRSTVR
jgi:hypothetical protein